MSNVTTLKHYTKPEDVQHVMYNKQEVEQIYACPVCGDLQVISGTVWHTKPFEMHPEEQL